MEKLKVKGVGMLDKKFLVRFALISLLFIAVNGCRSSFIPPYNNFKPYHRVYETTGPGAVVGAAAVLAASGPVAAGVILGGAVGASVGLYKDSKRALIREIERLGMKYIEYGHTVTIVVPTDRYFIFDSARFNELCFPGLNDLIKLIKRFPDCCPIYVAGFTDNVGSCYSKRRMSQAQAERMVGFLWANGIPSQRLIAEGYGDKNPVGDNHLIHGSAYNRRLEIQIITQCPPQTPILFTK